MASQHGAVVLPWGDGEYRFRLDLQAVEDIEDKCDRSLFDIARRMSPAVRDARLREYREVLRCGLIGGGMEPVKAQQMVKRWLDERPLDESRDIAYAVVLAGLARVHGDRAAEVAEGKPGEPAADPNASTSPPSEPAQPLSASTGPA